MIPAGPDPAAAAVPTSTGTIAAGSVRGRAPSTQRFMSGPRSCARARAATSRSSREAREVGRALLLVRVATLLRLLRHVEEQVGVVRQLLHAGEAVLLGVERRLQQPQRERREAQHLAAPVERLLLQPVQRDHGVDETHIERLLRVVLPAEEPDLLRLLRTDES